MLQQTALKSRSLPRYKIGRGIFNNEKIQLIFVHRIVLNAVVAALKVEVRACRVTCCTYITDRLSLGNVLSLADRKAAELSMDLLFPVAVVDLYILTVTAAAAAAAELAPVMRAIAVCIRNGTAVSGNYSCAHDSAAGDIYSTVVICGSVLVPL